MEAQQIKILETVITLGLYVVAFLITKFTINNTLKRVQFDRTRRKIIVKIIHLLIIVPVVVFLAGIPLRIWFDPNSIGITLKINYTVTNLV